MTVLHVINRSPLAHRALADCLRRVQPGHALLLIEDGVYGALAGGAAEALLAAPPEGLALYVLEPDLRARGLSGRPRLPGIAAVDYAGFVALAAAHPRCLSWR